MFAYICIGKCKLIHEYANIGADVCGRLHSARERKHAHTHKLSDMQTLSDTSLAHLDSPPSPHKNTPSLCHTHTHAQTQFFLLPLTKRTVYICLFQHCD